MSDTKIKSSNIGNLAVTHDKLHTTMDLTAKTVTIATPTANTHPATKLYVDTEVANLIDSAPGTLDTLNELAAAVNDDANFNATIASSIATKLPLAGGTLTGNLTIASTASGSSASPEFELRRDITGADANYIGQIKFTADNDADQNTVFAKITGKILDASDGTEDGIIEFAHKKAGSNNISARFRSDSLQLINGTNLTVAGTTDLTGNLTVDTNTLHVDTTNNRVGIGTSSPDSKIHLYDGALHVQQTDGSDTWFSYGTNNDNYITTGTSGITVFRSVGTERMRIDSSGNVGIGNTNPQGRLHLNDSGTAIPTSGYGTGLMVSRTDGLMGTMFGFLNSPQSGYLQVANFTNTDTLPFLINPRGGNVGIGTASPTRALTVASAGDAHVNTTSSHANGYAMFVSENSNDANNSWGAGRWHDGRYVISHNSAATWSQTGDTERLVIDTSGNVGIGQTVPVNRLHVSGADGYAYLKLTSDSTGHTASDGSRIGLNGNDLRIINAEAASILFQTQNTERMRIASNGMVLVGGTTNTNGGSLLKVGGSGNDGEITLNSDTTASYIVSYDRTAGAYHPIISTASEHQLNGGNVGIGDTAPSSLLSISKNSTRTNDFENMLKITHSSSNTTVAGFGSAIYFVGERNNGALQGMGRLIFDAEVNSGTNISSGFSVQTATAGSPSEKFRITHDGNVGIGTSSPTSNYGTNLNVHSSATNGAALHLTDGTTGNSNNDGFHLISTGGLAYVWNREATDMVFATSNTEKMRIRPDGKTRIGGTDAITSQLTLGNVSDPDKITIWSDRTNGARAERTKYLSKTVRPLYNPNQYFRLNLGASSSGTGATVRYQATFSTGHAAGHGYCEGVATFYAHHSTSKQMSTGTSGNPHISYARMYGNGSYYGWTTYPDIRFYLCGATGNNATSGAAIYIQTSGHGNHNSSTYDLYTDIQLDLQVMNSDYNADPHLTAVGHATPSDIGAQLGCTFLS